MLIKNLKDSSWKNALGPVLSDSRFLSCAQFVEERRQTASVYPPPEQIFSAFNLTPLAEVKVVIVGQDPYHGPGQAHGLSFSVPTGVRFPPSLLNIFKELKEDVGGEMPSSGDLTTWARQGVLLLNAVLSVEEGQANSHQGKGWELLTDRAIQAVSENCENVVFVLWGSFAQKKICLIDQQKHLILKGVHPSPLSSYRGFFGSKPFSKINMYLTETGQKVIDWNLKL